LSGKTKKVAAKKSQIKDNIYQISTKKDKERRSIKNDYDKLRSKSLITSSLIKAMFYFNGGSPIQITSKKS